MTLVCRGESFSNMSAHLTSSAQVTSATPRFRGPKCLPTLPFDKGHFLLCSSELLCSLVSSETHRGQDLPSNPGTKTTSSTYIKVDDDIGLQEKTWWHTIWNRKEEGGQLCSRVSLIFRGYWLLGSVYKSWQGSYYCFGQSGKEHHCRVL